ncbi:hypothetical protein CAOG_01790 [Capsaspora owczarzaki ATCC 30864]|uniref:Uncharacterized protein n=1 Tax=Capsaspora owczarzaki (strain ATCC 30864) TaxID=595528 RepID=A0A0D2X1A7_CAPO3|nr:hypothetical protein CAOG_01790 [Capsaspora owczarzaki ATCC 30864]KJE90479.1 hypothetical protein CAOG_001790 [Capsaspora owczarzaki ATCC 30864]|eukprot:XP_004364658.1 hypothetical protein CAOG_01790 [Capsaspora owczarzaki ATCC 30864]
MADRQLRSARQVVAIGTGHPRPANGDDMAQVLALLNAPTTIALDAALMPQQGILVSHGRWNAAPSTASISLANHGLDQSTRSDLPWSGNETLRLCEIVQRCEQAAGIPFSGSWRREHLSGGIADTSNANTMCEFGARTPSKSLRFLRQARQSSGRRLSRPTGMNELRSIEY